MKDIAFIKGANRFFRKTIFKNDYHVRLFTHTQKAKNKYH